ncbi:MAG: hypothetical protein HYY65_08115 [Candidatus Tectomicrobia bacterium]|uniref:Uncharacterized protein n=1 Tax=Tectimicrobiota bacterium TaxID=2528274 RepID=A0A932GQ19_UNCTE|nr:hypothetical protein [Candidatus Tectomicrobia bacterium]
MGIEKSHMRPLFGAISNPQDKVRVKTAAAEESDAHFGKVTKEEEFEVTIWLGFVVVPPEVPQILCKFSLRLPQPRRTHGHVFRPVPFGTQKKRAKKVLVNVETRQWFPTITE